MNWKNLRQYLSALAVLAYMRLIYYLSSIPGSDIHLETPDYILHALAFGGLSLFVTLFFLHHMRLRVGIFASLFTIFLFGLSDEAHQSFVPLRTPDWRDIAADVVGALIMQILLVLIIRLYFFWKSGAEKGQRG